jgi:hypothetical protein
MSGESHDRRGRPEAERASEDVQAHLFGEGDRPVLENPWGFPEFPGWKLLVGMCRQGAKCNSSSVFSFKSRIVKCLKGAAADQNMFKCSSNGKHAKRHQMVKWQFIRNDPNILDVT